MHYHSIIDRTVWGYRGTGRIINFYRKFPVYLGFASLFLQLLYLFLRFGSINVSVIGTLFSIIPVNILVVVCLVSAKGKSYKKLISEFMDKIHLYNFINEHEVVSSITEKVERSTRWTTYAMSVLLTIDWLSWVLIPAINNYLNKDLIENKTMQYQTCIYFWAPFDYEHSFRNWIIIHFLNIYYVWAGCFIIALYGAVGYIFIFALIGHIEVMKHKLSSQFSGNRNEEDIFNKLVAFIRYHAFTNELFKDIQSAFGFNVTANYLHNLVGDSVMLYLIMNGNKGNFVVFGLMIVVYMGNLVLISFVLEEIRYQSNTLSNAVYDIPWEDMSQSNKKIVLLILANVQKPLQFRGVGGVNTGLYPMLSIFKSTFSVYIMLKATV